MGLACNLLPAHSQFRDQFSEGPPLATLAQAIALPTDFSAKLARNTQLILAEETGITRVGGCGDWLVVLNVRSGVQLVQCRYRQC